MIVRRVFLVCVVIGTTALGATAIVALATRDGWKPVSETRCLSQVKLTDGCRAFFRRRIESVTGRRFQTLEQAHDALDERGHDGEVETQARLPPARRLRTPAVLVRVVDGDTIRAQIRSGRQITVRILGMDTPETKRPGTPVQCGGPEATEGLRARLKADVRIALLGDPSQDAEDRYGRTLAYVDREGRDIGREMVSVGLAEVYVFQQGAPFDRVKAYRSAEATARSENRGNWQRCPGQR